MMDRKLIEQWARECDIDWDAYEWADRHGTNNLERFAALVAAHEREHGAHEGGSLACATVGQPARELADAREEMRLQATLITKLWKRIGQLQDALREAGVGIPAVTPIATQPTGRKD